MGFLLKDNLTLFSFGDRVFDCVFFWIEIKIKKKGGEKK